MKTAVQLRVGAPQYGGSFAVDDADPLPYVLPGELVAADPLHIFEPSQNRIAPGCVHFGVCGGCQYQHALYAAQNTLKRDILHRLLRGAGLDFSGHVESHAGPEWGYRNRIRLRVARVDGTLRVGYSRRATNEFLPVVECPIAAPLLWRAAERLLALADDTACQTWLAAVREVELFCLPDETRLQMTLFVDAAGGFAGDAASFSRCCERLRESLPELVSAGAEVDPELNRRARRAWAGVAWGAGGLVYPAAGRGYWVPRGAFFQVNRFLVDELARLVCDGARGRLAWDLFAGVGLFTRALAERFERVIAVEAGEAAASALAAAGRGAKGQPAFTAVREPVLDFLRARVLERDRPEMVVLDPPRAGLGVEGAALLARVGAPGVVYVSCDPVTLARDLAVLCREAYRIVSVDLVDLFPQTFHLETVVRLERR